MTTAGSIDTAAARLQERMAGQLLRVGTTEYEQARPVWNGMIEARPALIARCASTADVAAVVGFAAENDLALAVRGGGHNVAGLGTCEGGIVADLSGMQSVRVDPAQRLARVQGGATWGVLDAATQAHGLATPGGLVSTTGIAGLTLGGGIGWLMRRWGLTCDNLVSAEVVTADARVVTAGEDGDAELLWGLRGGGGNFGVVTDFTYRLHPLGPTVLGGMVLHPLERAEEVLGFWREWVTGLPDELTTMVAFVSAPPEPFVPEEFRLAPAVAVLACYAGPPEEGEPLVAPLRRLGPPVVDVLGPMPYLALQSMLDTAAPRGLRNYWKSGYLTDPAPAAAALIDTAATRPSPLSQVHLHHLGGAVARVDEQATAFAHRQAPFALNIVGMWADPGDDEANLSWARWHHRALQPFVSGAYVNFLADSGPDHLSAAYAPATRARLSVLKRRYDPGNLFRINHNVAPA